MTARSITAASRGRVALTLALLAGAAVTLTIGIYARVHQPALRPLFLIGFSGMLQLKAWLTTLAVLLVLVQLITALWMWGRLPDAGPAPGWVPGAHRWSGSVAFALSVPVALHCIWALGLQGGSARVLAHGILGCLFYGAYAAKMLGLRLRGLPAWTLPVLGGVVFALFVLLWVTSALWFFTRSGVPLV
jgi:hypothetical protein